MPNTISATPVADAIRAMQDRLGRPEWWVQNRYRDGDAGCLIAAVSDVIDPSEKRIELLDVLIETARGWSSNPSTSVAGLNDWELKSHHELLLFLDAALDVAESEGL